MATKSSAVAQASPDQAVQGRAHQAMAMSTSTAAQATDLLLLNWRAGQLRCNLEMVAWELRATRPRFVIASLYRFLFLRAFVLLNIPI